MRFMRLPCRISLVLDSGVTKAMSMKLSSCAAAPSRMGTRGPSLLPSTPPRGKATMKAPPIEMPWKMPRLMTRRSGGEASVTYAWQTGLMHEETPSIRSARYSRPTDDLVVPCSRHVSPYPRADHAISAFLPLTSESAQRKPTPRKVRTLSTASTSPLSLIDAGVTPTEPSGLTMEETTRGRLGTLSPSERK